MTTEWVLANQTICWTNKLTDIAKKIDVRVWTTLNLNEIRKTSGRALKPSHLCRPSLLGKHLALGELGRSLHSYTAPRPQPQYGPFSMAIFGQFSATISRPTSTNRQLVQHEHSCSSPFGQLVSVLKTATPTSMCIIY